VTGAMNLSMLAIRMNYIGSDEFTDIDDAVDGLCFGNCVLYCVFILATTTISRQSTAVAKWLNTPDVVYYEPKYQLRPTVEQVRFD
jgi:hypothetical protein